MGTRRLKGAVGGWGDTPDVKRRRVTFLSTKYETSEVIQFPSLSSEFLPYLFLNGINFLREPSAFSFSYVELDR